MEFYKKINVDNIKNKIPPMPNMSAIQLPKMKSRKIFKSSKENIATPQTLNKPAAPPTLAVPSSTFVDRTPTRISTVSSLKGDRQGYHYVSYNETHIRSQTHTYVAADPSFEEDNFHPNEERGAENPKPEKKLTERFSKHYKEFSEFKFKNLFGKKTVVKKTEIEVDMYAESFREELQEEEERQRRKRFDDEESEYNFEIRESRPRSTHTKNSDNGSSSPESVKSGVPSPIRDDIRALHSGVTPPLSKRKNLPREEELERSRRSMLNFGSLVLSDDEMPTKDEPPKPNKSTLWSKKSFKTGRGDGFKDEKTKEPENATHNDHKWSMQSLKRFGAKLGGEDQGKDGEEKGEEKPHHHSNLFHIKGLKFGSKVAEEDEENKSEDKPPPRSNRFSVKGMKSFRQTSVAKQASVESKDSSDDEEKPTEHSPKERVWKFKNLRPGTNEDNTDDKPHKDTIWKMRSRKSRSTADIPSGVSADDESSEKKHPSHLKESFLKLTSLMPHQNAPKTDDDGTHPSHLKESFLKLAHFKQNAPKNEDEDHEEPGAAASASKSTLWEMKNFKFARSASSDGDEEPEKYGLGRFAKYKMSTKKRGLGPTEAVGHHPDDSQTKTSNLIERLKIIRAAKKSSSVDDVSMEEEPHESKKSGMVRFDITRETAMKRMNEQMHKIKLFQKQKSKDSQDRNSPIRKTNPSHFGRPSRDGYDEEDDDDIEEINNEPLPTRAVWATSKMSLEADDFSNIPSVLIHQELSGNEPTLIIAVTRPAPPIPMPLISKSSTIPRSLSPTSSSSSNTSPMRPHITPIIHRSAKPNQVASPSPPSSPEIPRNPSPLPPKSEDKWIPNKQIISDFFGQSPPNRNVTPEFPNLNRKHSRKPSMDSNDSDSWIPEHFTTLKASSTQGALNKINENAELWKSQKIHKTPSIDIFADKKEAAFEDFEDELQDVPIMEVKENKRPSPPIRPPPPVTPPPPPPKTSPPPLPTSSPPTSSPPAPALPKRKPPPHIPARTESMVNLPKPLIKQSSLRRQSEAAQDFNFGHVNKLISRFESQSSMDSLDDDDDLSWGGGRNQTTAKSKSKGLTRQSTVRERTPEDVVIPRVFTTKPEKKSQQQDGNNNSASSTGAKATQRVADKPTNNNGNEKQNTKSDDGTVLAVPNLKSRTTNNNNNNNSDTKTIRKSKESKDDEKFYSFESDDETNFYSLASSPANSVVVTSTQTSYVIEF